MPILIFVLLAILIAQVGFWDTLGGILGAIAMVVLFAVLALAAIALTGFLLLRRLNRPRPPSSLR